MPILQSILALGHANKSNPIPQNTKRKEEIPETSQPSRTRRVAQMAERSLSMGEVRGSMPRSSTFFRLMNFSVFFLPYFSTLIVLLAPFFYLSMVQKDSKTQVTSRGLIACDRPSVVIMLSQTGSSAPLFCAFSSADLGTKRSVRHSKSVGHSRLFSERRSPICSPFGQARFILRSPVASEMITLLDAVRQQSEKKRGAKTTHNCDLLV